MTIRQETANACRQLCETAHFLPGEVVVIGGSSSEIAGGTIGKDSSMEIGAQVIAAAMEVAAAYEIGLAIQCCEHLNRALVVERAVARRYGWEEVAVVPWQHAGGALATNAMTQFADPIVVERVAVHGGLDIGQTLIGMHLRRVAVPVRLAQRYIGQAIVTAARTRPALIGGVRARYE